jgi:hypothetical protein
MTIAASRKPSLSVGARVVFGSALMLGALSAQAYQADSSTALSGTAPVMRGTTGRQLWRISDYSTVELVAREAGAPANQHPWTIEPNTLHALLQQVQVIRSGAAKPLFAIDELSNIVPALTEALAHARPDQDIALVSSARHEDNTFFSITAVTARLFVVDGHLNMIVHDPRVDFYDTARGTGMAPHFTVGSRTAEGTAPVQSPSATNKRGDWLVLSATSAPPAVAVPCGTAGSAGRRAGRAGRDGRAAGPCGGGRGAACACSACGTRHGGRRAAPDDAQASLRQGPHHEVRVREEAPGDPQVALSDGRAAAASDCNASALAVAAPAAVLSKITQGTAPSGHSARAAAWRASQASS